MGKSSKKSASKVDVAPVVAVPVTKSGKKGKRETEEAIEKLASAKKQKMEVKTLIKKKVEPSSSDEGTESSSDSEIKQQGKGPYKKVVAPAKPTAVESSSEDETSSDDEPAVKGPLLSKKAPPAVSRNGTAGTPAKEGQQASSSDSSSGSDEEEVPESKGAASLKKLSTAVPNKKVESSDSDSSDSGTSSDEDEKPLQVTKTLAAAATISKKKEEEDSSDTSDSDGSSDEETVKTEKSVQPKKLGTAAVKNGSVVAPKKKVDSVESSDESDGSGSDSDEEKITASKTVSSTPKKKSDSSDTSSESDSEEEEAPNAKAAVSLKRPAETKELKQAESDSDDSDDSDESDGEPQPKKIKSAIPSSAGKPSLKKPVTESSSEGSSDESEEESEEEPSKTPKKSGTDVEMIDATSPKTNTKQVVTASEKKVPKTPATQSTGSKTLFVGNLPFDVEQDDVINFFKDVGEVVDVRISFNEDGRPKGYGHVEFATMEEAQKALELNGESLMGRQLRLDTAHEKGSYTPNTGRESNSFQKGGRGQGHTAYVRGFDTSVGEEEIRNSLVEHFGSCGEISGQAIRLPTDRETGNVKGFAYLEFNDADSLNKALELNGSELGEGYLKVDVATPRDGDGGRGGGRYSGGRSGRGGRDGGRDGRGRGGRDGGRFGSRGRGRGPSMAAFGTGKKTTFDD